CARSWDYFDYW
nr:immunoglobulin heavy chain junction region [Mus musculus]MBK4184412.1 immunoglobulin heavy chain junction region [Mus musculus]MBK4185547.1 immunoglobulin heavy chain junction region [Mus musculus]MBK4185548.1 immunoglobulin heavy chain junction region [Mus musculus]MBK4189371.1 immunoglobulin heavy chain junction region [Mus musculus]